MEIKDRVGMHAQMRKASSNFSIGHVWPSQSRPLLPIFFRSLRSIYEAEVALTPLKLVR